MALLNEWYWPESDLDTLDEWFGLFHAMMLGGRGEHGEGVGEQETG